MGNLKLESNSFANGQKIPQKFGYKHGNVSPHLKINGVSSYAKSLALIMDDPDAMGAVGKIWVHWVLWNIDPSTKEIPESSTPSNSIHGKNDFGEYGYGGPAPPDKEHTYIFKLYSLNKKLSLPKATTKSELEDAMKNSILDEAVLKGTFSP